MLTTNKPAGDLCKKHNSPATSAPDISRPNGQESASGKLECAAILADEEMAVKGKKRLCATILAALLVPFRRPQNGPKARRMAHAALVRIVPAAQPAAGAIRAYAVFQSHSTTQSSGAYRMQPRDAGAPSATNHEDRDRPRPRSFPNTWPAISPDDMRKVTESPASPGLVTRSLQLARQGLAPPHPGTCSKVTSGCCRGPNLG